MEETKNPTHVATPALRLMVDAADKSFTEEQLYWLAEEFEVLAFQKFMDRIEADDSWIGEIE